MIELDLIDQIKKDYPNLAKFMINESNQNKFTKGQIQKIQRSPFSGSAAKPVTDGEKSWPSVSKAAQDLGVSPKTIRNWIQNHQMLWSYRDK